MQNTTAIVLAGALLTAGWSLATGYVLRPYAIAWFAAAAAGAQASAGTHAAPSPRAGRQTPVGSAPFQSERCSGDYVCDEPASLTDNRNVN